MPVTEGRAVAVGLIVRERVQRRGRERAVVDRGQNGVLIREAVTGETKESPAVTMLREMLFSAPRGDA